MKETTVLDQINNEPNVLGILYCQHILDSPNVIQEISDFKINIKTGYGLEYYLKYNAITDEHNNLSKTYFVKDCVTNEVVGYFSLRTGMVSVNEKKTLFFHSTFDTYPAIELANFAVNDVYKENHPDVNYLGEIIFKNFILPLIQYLSKYVGINIVMIYALPQPKLINFYESLGFYRLPKKTERQIHNRMKPTYDQNCIFMFQKI